MKWWQLIEIILERTAIGAGVGAAICAGTGAAVGAGIGAATGLVSGAGIGTVYGCATNDKAGVLANAADGAKSGTIIGASVGSSIGTWATGKLGTIIGAGSGFTVGLIEVLVVCCHGPTKLLEVPLNCNKISSEGVRYIPLTEDHITQTKNNIVRQIGTGDCYLIAPIISKLNCSDIESCFINKEDFIKNDENQLPSEAIFRFYKLKIKSDWFSSKSTAIPAGEIKIKVPAKYRSDGAGKELWWLGLIERAFAEYLATPNTIVRIGGFSLILEMSGIIGDGFLGLGCGCKKSYLEKDLLEGYNGGLSYIAMAAITGKETERQLLCKSSLLNYVKKSIESEHPLTIGTFLKHKCGDIKVGDIIIQKAHEYAVKSYNEEDNTIVLINPNKPSNFNIREIKLDFEEFYNAFNVLPFVGINVTSFS